METAFTDKTREQIYAIAAIVSSDPEQADREWLKLLDSLDYAGRIRAYVTVGELQAQQ